MDTSLETGFGFIANPEKILRQSTTRYNEIKLGMVRLIRAGGTELRDRDGHGRTGTDTEEWGEGGRGARYDGGQNRDYVREELVEEKARDVEEMVELAVELGRVLTEIGEPRAELLVPEIVRIHSVDQIREMIREMREELRESRLEVAELAKLPGYLVLDFLQFLKREAASEDVAITMRMAWGLDPSG